MATKTFSSRADAEKLAYAGCRLAKKECGMSFGQYCGTVLLNGIEQTANYLVTKMKTSSNGKNEQ